MNDEKYTLILGECLENMRVLPDNSVDSVVTDPPYGLSFMGKRWDYDVPSVDVWSECLRVLKPGGHLLAFAGTRTQHRMAVRIEDAGFEIRDMIAWVYGSGFPKSHNLKDEWDGWGTALKPALEPITVARKPLIGTVADNVQQHGTGALNVDGCRISALTGQRPDSTLTAWEPEKNLCDLCARLAASPAKPETPAIRDISAGSPAAPTTSGKGENTRADTGKADIGCFAGPCPEGHKTGQTADFSLSIDVSGKMLEARSQKATKSTTSTATDSTTDLKTCNACGCSITDPGTSGSMPALKNATPNTPAAQGNAALGRWPSNLIHDGSEEVTGLFPVTTSGKPMKRTHTDPGRNVASGASAGGEYFHDGYGDTGSAARFFYCAKASKADRDEGCEGLEPRNNMRVNGPRESEEAKHATKRSNHHPTVKPTALMRYLCRLVTPPGGVVLDPFMGSGSTGKAAAVEGFHFIGIEQDESYFNIARARIQEAYSQRLI